MSDISGISTSTTPTAVGNVDALLREARTSATATQSTGTDSSRIGMDSFLKLLVAQLKYQNPLDPSDSTEFMNQTAQFTMVERLTELTQQGTDGQLASRLSVAGNLVGKVVAYTDDSGQAQQGQVSSVRVSDGETVLRVGDVTVPLELVQEVLPAASSVAAGVSAAQTLMATASAPTNESTSALAASASELR